jgi:hypothetical protein
LPKKAAGQLTLFFPLPIVGIECGQQFLHNCLIVIYFIQAIHRIGQPAAEAVQLGIHLRLLGYQPEFRVLVDVLRVVQPAPFVEVVT